MKHKYLILQLPDLWLWYQIAISVAAANHARRRPKKTASQHHSKEQRALPTLVDRHRATQTVVADLT